MAHKCPVLSRSKPIRSELKRIDRKKKIVLDPFQPTPYSTAPLTQRGQRSKCGEVSEWLKEHAWKVCIRQRIGGSNPPLTATFKEEPERKFRLFFCILHCERGVRTPAGIRQHAQHAGQRSLRRCPKGERSESIPSHRHILKKSLNESSGFFFAYCTARGG